MQSMKLVEADVPVPFINIQAIATVSTEVICNIKPAPPLLHNGVPIYIFNCIYRI
jgi:hypothetical protein